MRSLQATALVLALGLTAMACSSTASGATPKPAVASEVDIQLFTFKPTPLKVPVGTTVVWKNQDAIEHSVTAGKASTMPGEIDSHLFNQGQSFQYTFAAAGDFLYYCMRHPSMEGEVIVY